MTRRKSHDIAEAEHAKVEQEKNSQPVTFKRIDPTKFSNIATHFADNTFEAKAKFG